MGLDSCFEILIAPSSFVCSSEASIGGLNFLYSRTENDNIAWSSCVKENELWVIV